MKKIYLLSGLILCLFMQANAQNASLKDAGIDYINKKAKAWNLTETDFEDAIVSSEVYTKHNGVTFLYLNQTYKGTPIYNAISVLSFKDGKVFHSVNGFHSNIEERIIGAKTAALSPSQALYKVAKQLEIAGPQVSMQKAVGDEVIFDGMNISREEIPVKPMYQLTEEGKLVLSYDLSILMMDNADYWSIRVDANTGEIVGKDNWTVYCQYESVANHSHQDGKCSHAPLKASKYFGASATDNATYSVYALPAESPIHGPFVTVNNPAYPEASPFGWHDINGEAGPEYTITRGNNVHAYIDDMRQNSSRGDEPDGGADLIFDFDHNTEGEPLESAEAATVNLFYMNNMMHDLMYLFGFDEVSGNFQQTNYSGQGAGTDFVQAEALDDASTPFIPGSDDPSNGARNNANFATPPDGGNGRMQMYVWINSSDVFKITSPSQLSGIIQGGEVGTANFGEPINSTTNVAGELAIARDGTPDSPTQACREIVNASEIAGKIAIVDRGLCDFSRKAYNVQQAGAIGCIIVNVPGVNGGSGEEVIPMGAGDNATEVIIPSIFIKTSDGNAIKEVLENTPVEGLFRDESTTAELDGSFDNGVIAHEYGHGISTRLTGGPNIGCLGSREQMGEGWSDFFSLITTVEPGDQGSDARGIGTFASGETRDGGGIRQFPYSTDMNINPHTYADVAIQDGSVHGIGSVWCAMIWDLYWAMVDEYGYSDDWRDTESGNFKAIQLVMDGMRFQGCDPEFVQGRQGILQADLVNYNGENEELIWRVFARRGLGFYADSGSTESSTDGVEDFNMPPLLVEELKINRTSLELAKPGEILPVTLDIVNHIPSTQENVIVTDEIQEGLSYVQGSASIEPTINGNVLTFDIGTMAYEEERSITYEVRLDESSRSESILLDDFEDDMGWEEEDLEGSGFSWFNDDIGIEESAGWGVDELDIETDQVLISPTISIVGDNPTIRFWHYFDVRNTENGGFVQISTNDGLTWQSVRSENFVRNGYTSELQYTLFAIPSLDGFTGVGGDINNFIDSYIDVSDYNGQDIKVRFRFGSQPEGTPSQNIPFPGWYIDDFELIDLKTYSSTACIGTIAEPNQNCSMNTVVSDIDGLVSNDEVEKDYFGVRIFPNPAEDYITVGISAPNNETAQVRLINVDGRVVHTSSRQVSTDERVQSIITRDFAPGMYIVEVRTNNKVTTKKAIIK